MSSDHYLLDNRAVKAGNRIARACRRCSTRSGSATSTRWGSRPAGAAGRSAPADHRWRAGWRAALDGEGRVLATNIEICLRRRGSGARIEVRHHDVVREPPPDGIFNLVHARLVLVHLPVARGRCKR